MKISVIVPSNNTERSNDFIKSFKTMKDFNKYCEVIIVGNGKLNQKEINIDKNIHCIYVTKNTKDNIIPFAFYRGSGMMIGSDADYFLFLDDDNKFPDCSDNFYIECIGKLEELKCGTLQADKYRDGKTGIEKQKTGFFWTGYGLFIKNINLPLYSYIDLLGCCEETLYCYETLNKYGLPYIIYGNPTTRDTSKNPKHNELNHKSYSEKTIQNNIQGYIQIKYKDLNWRYYNNIPNNNFPKFLQEKINDRK